jgi:hypothetical protein
MNLIYYFALFLLNLEESSLDPKRLWNFDQSRLV